MKLIKYSIILFTAFISSCNLNHKSDMSLDKDNHTYANITDARIKHLDLNLTADFHHKVLKGFAEYTIETSDDTKDIILDNRFLNINRILVDNEEVNFVISEDVNFIGQSLTIPVNHSSKKVKVFYETTENSEAIQWLSKEQTADKTAPFLFTQGQAILTRTWIPVQDTPSNKITYDATIKVPENLMAVMSADNNPHKKNKTGIYHFSTKEPIVPYLIALAIGDIYFKEINDISGVYAEKSSLKNAAKEFEDVGEMIDSASALYGKYAWNRYDILVLPPSFPFGGMENPKLTFATPTIITGDKSLTSLIAHELAHSWSGNLVTNSTWDDFWLNEGFTVYFERRIVESLYGKTYVAMLWELGYQDLTNTIVDLHQKNLVNDTKLKLNLNHRNPDDGLTDIAYEKGALMLLNIENKIGRGKFDNLINSYFNQFKYTSINTEDFVSYFYSMIDSSEFNIKEWIYEINLPENHYTLKSERFILVENKSDKYFNHQQVLDNTQNWSTHEWLHFIRTIPTSIDKSVLDSLDNQINFTNSTNAEIAFAWFMEKINRKELTDIKQPLIVFLHDVGRRKFILPLYHNLIKNNYQEFAKTEYSKNKLLYHSVTNNSVELLFR